MIKTNLMCTQEQERKFLSVPTDQDALKIFPEFLALVPAKLDELREEVASIVTRIKDELQCAKDAQLNEPSYAVIRWSLKQTLILELCEIKKQAARLSALAEGRIPTGWVTEAMIDQARSRSLLEVAGQFLQLMRRGHRDWSLCPFHDENTPSFYVNPERNRFHCFGCGRDGDVITFVCLIRNFSFVEAVRWLAGRASS